MNQAGEAIGRAHRDPTFTHIHVEDLTAPSAVAHVAMKGRPQVWLTSIVGVAHGRMSIMARRCPPGRAFCRLQPPRPTMRLDAYASLGIGGTKSGADSGTTANLCLEIRGARGGRVVLTNLTERIDALRNITRTSPGGATYAKVRIRWSSLAYFPTLLPDGPIIKVATRSTDALWHSGFPPIGDFAARVTASQFKQPEAKHNLREIGRTETRAATEAATGTLTKERGAKSEKAGTRLPKDRGPLLTFCDFPAKHWDYLRIGNPIKGVFASICHVAVRNRGRMPPENCEAFGLKARADRRKIMTTEGRKPAADGYRRCPIHQQCRCKRRRNQDAESDRVTEDQHHLECHRFSESA